MAENEVQFREVSERVGEMSDRLGPNVPYEHLCDCPNADCTFRLELSTSEYEAVRADPTQFRGSPLRYTPEIETLAAEHDKSHG